MQEIVSSVCTTSQIEIYLFGSQECRTNLLENLISELSQSTLAFNPVQSPKRTFLHGHPKRLMTLDEIFSVRVSELLISDILGVSVDALLDKTFSSQFDVIDHSVALVTLGHHFMKRYWRFAEIFDLNEAICYYQEALSMFTQNDYHYLEVLLGLCSGFFHRFQLLGRQLDLQHLLTYLRLQLIVDMKAVSWPNGYSGVSKSGLDGHPPCGIEDLVRPSSTVLGSRSSSSSHAPLCGRFSRST